MKFAIVGAGELGRWLAAFAKDFGKVTVSDINTRKAHRVASELGISAKSAEDAVRGADVIIVAVPISKTPQVVISISSMAKKGALLADVASVKTDVVNAMQKIKAEIELVSLHPLFGPRVATIKDKDIVVIPVKAGRRYRELRKLFVDQGARITEMGADAHDQVMAIIQCLTQFVLLSYTHALKSTSGVKKAKELRTPMSGALMNLGKAILAGNSKVYSEIQVHNKYAKTVRKSLIDACRSLDSAFSAGGAKTVEKAFKEALKQFGQNETRSAYLKVYKQFEEDT